MTNFDAVVDRLFRQNEFAIKYDLDAMTAAVRVLGLGRAARRVFIVAGTNGKGSTSAWLHGLARASGQRVGLFTSPHLVDVRERIRVDGHPMPIDAFAARFGPLLARFGDPQTSEAGRALTYFELLTLGAWSWFEDRALDVAIFEVGLGGRLDATNLVDADIAVFTALGLDHVEYLGDTLTSIACEKAAVARPGRPAWVHPGHPGVREITAALAEIGADVRSAPGPVSPDPMTRNRDLALAAWCDAFGVDDVAARSLLGATSARIRWPGRRDVRTAFGREWWLDGAHNPDATRALAPWVGARAGEHGVDAVLAASPGRDLDALVGPLARHLKTVHVCPASSFRSAAPADVAAALRRAGVAEVQVHATAPDAFDACAAASSQRPVLVAGSLYLVGAWLSHAGETAESLVIDVDPTSRRAT